MNKDYTELNCIYSIKLLNKLHSLNETSDTKIDIETIKYGMLFAKRNHAGQFRKSGEPYYAHLTEVAQMVADYIFNTEIIIVALLHDVLEDTSATYDNIIKRFGKNIGDKVKDLTRDDATTSANIVEKLWHQEKQDVLLVKLCDRMHNMLTISAKPSDKIRKTAKETLSAFLVVAAYLGTRDIEAKLSDLCIQYIDHGLVNEEELF